MATNSYDVIFTFLAKLITRIPETELLSQFPKLMIDLNSLEELDHWDPLLSRITELIIFAKSQNDHQLLGELVLLILLFKHTSIMEVNM